MSVHGHFEKMANIYMNQSAFLVGNINICFHKRPLCKFTRALHKCSLLPVQLSSSVVTSNIFPPLLRRRSAELNT